MANLRADNLTGTGGRNAINGSLYFGGDNDPAGLTIADNTDLELGSETNWTIEFWIKLNHAALSDWDVVMGKGSNDNGGTEYEWFVEVMAANHLVFLSTTAGTAWDFNQQITPVLEIGEWYHVAIVRNGSGSNTLKSYVNGQQYSSHTSQNIYTGNDEFGIGHFAHTNGLNSDVTLSNVRIVKGTSVYTAAFTPPTEKLTVVPNTVLLCCQDSDNPLQEETGKTITAVGGLDINETEYVTNGTFGGSGTSPGGSTYSPAWTAWGDTTTAQNGGLFIERTSTLTGVYQLLTPTGSIPKGQYRIRGTISNKTGPGSAIIRLSSASQGNGTIFFGSYGPGVVESTVNYSGSGNLYLNLMLGNNTGSADFSNISFRKVFTATGVPKVFPPVGVDEGVTFEGDTKVNTQSYMYFPTGDTSQRGRGRGLLMGGSVSPGSTNTTQIKYFDIASQGITDDFGQTTVARRSTGSLSSSTRGLMGGGFVAPTSPAHTVSDVIDYVTIATTANAIDFGNMQSTGYAYGTASNETRGLFAGGYRPNNSAVVKTIDLITIATKGDATNFGDLVVARRGYGGLASPTRGIFMGGAPSTKDEIDYVTIATAGDATDFGDLTDGRDNITGGSSSTRGVMGGGRTPSNTNIIDYITIATTGNATDFGDLLSATYYYAATSNGSRTVWVGDSGITNTMEYVTIATTGNSIDWGDQGGTTQHSGGACSDSHGGLS